VGGNDHRRSDRIIKIIGVVRSRGRYAPRIYYPLGQHPTRNTYLLVQFAPNLDASAMVGSLRREVLALDPENPPLLARPLRHFIDQNINLSLLRLAAAGSATFGAVALLLALVGVHGVKAQAVARRTREIGIRMALGAQRGDVLALVLTQGALQTALGISAGVALALLAGQTLSKMLFRVNPFDPLALVAAALLLSAAALLACFLPARRATRVDPSAALRAE
jgi:putative ABC transport system permease protein